MIRLNALTSARHLMISSVSWVQRDSSFLKAVDGLALLLTITYTVVFLRERAGLARPRRLKSAATSAIGLFLFSVLIGVRVFIIHG